METAAEQRRKAIVDTLVEQHSVKTADLSQQLGVSEVMIRRDLSALERQGMVKRVHGGAILVPAGAGASAAAFLSPKHLAEKERIGRATAALIRPGSRIIIDSGTTALQVARQLPGALLTSGNLTVITSSLPVVQTLGGWQGVHLIVLGGIYLHEYQVAVGPQTLEQIRGLHADQVVLGADGLTLEHGLTTANILEAEVDRAIVRAASEVIAVADSSKIGRIGLSQIATPAEIDVLVTDRAAPEDFLDEIRRLGVTVILA